MDAGILNNPVTGESMTVLESTPEIFKFKFSLGPHGSIAGAHFHPSMEQRVSVVSGELHFAGQWRTPDSPRGRVSHNPGRGASPSGEPR